MLFPDPATIPAVRAEGHYTTLLRGIESLCCPWSITEVKDRLTQAGFIRAQRSHFHNPTQVAHFECTKGSGLCHRAGDIASAIALLTERDDKARGIAGGHSLIPMMKLRS